MAGERGEDGWSIGVSEYGTNADRIVPGKVVDICIGFAGDGIDVRIEEGDGPWTRQVCSTLIPWRVIEAMMRAAGYRVERAEVTSE